MRMGMYIMVVEMAGDGDVGGIFVRKKKAGVRSLPVLRTTAPIFPLAIHYVGELLDPFILEVSLIILPGPPELFDDLMRAARFGFQARSSWLDMKLVGNTKVQCMTGPDRCAYIERAVGLFLKPIDVPEVRKRESVAETLDAETCITNNYMSP